MKSPRLVRLRAWVKYMMCSFQLTKGDLISSVTGATDLDLAIGFEQDR